MDEEELFLNHLFQTFQAEAEEHFTAIRQHLLSYQQLQNAGEQTKLLESAFREAHNFKGSAATLGLEGLVTLAHALEDRLSALRKRELSLAPEAFDAGDEWIESVAKLVSGGESRQALMDTDPDPFVQRLDTARLGTKSAPAPAPAPKASPAPEAREEAWRPHRR